MNQCGTNRFMPRKNQKIEKDLFNFFWEKKLYFRHFSRILRRNRSFSSILRQFLPNFPKKRGWTGSARDKPVQRGEPVRAALVHIAKKCAWNQNNDRENSKNETVRHEPVRRAELVSLALNRFSRVFLEKLVKIAYNLSKMTVFGVKSWKIAENITFFLKNKLNNYWPFFGFLRGSNRFQPHCFNWVLNLELWAKVCRF